MRCSFTAIAAALILAGCGGNPTVSENQCIASDWQTLGLRDAVNGFRSTQLLEHQNACGKYGIIPNRDAYMAGWQEGVREFCQPHNAYSIGLSGRGHNNICPPDLQPIFLAAYHNGRELHAARADVYRLERLIESQRNRLETIKLELVASATNQLDPELTAAQRIQLLAQTDLLNSDRKRIKRELPQLLAALTVKEEYLRHVENSLATR